MKVKLNTAGDRTKRRKLASGASLEVGHSVGQKRKRGAEEDEDEGFRTVKSSGLGRVAAGFRPKKVVNHIRK